MIDCYSEIVLSQLADCGKPKMRKQFLSDVVLGAMLFHAQVGDCGIRYLNAGVHSNILVQLQHDVAILDATSWLRGVDDLFPRDCSKSVVSGIPYQ